MSITDEELRKLARFSGKIPAEPPDATLRIEEHFGVSLPETLKRIHRLGGDASILFYIDDELNACDFHALLVNPFEFYGSNILASHESILSQLDQRREAFRRVIPFGQNGGGGKFCLDYRTSADPCVALYNWEYRLIARSFDEFIDRALPERRKFWSTRPHAISKSEQRNFRRSLPEFW